jgi:hypothetical protein
MNKYNSPYSAAMTGCAFLYYEFQRILPLLMSDNAEKQLKDEIENNRILQVNSRKARRTFVLEFKRRYAAVPKIFGMYGLHGARMDNAPVYCMLS